MEERRLVGREGPDLFPSPSCLGSRSFFRPVYQFLWSADADAVSSMLLHPRVFLSISLLQTTIPQLFPLSACSKLPQHISGLWSPNCYMPQANTERHTFSFSALIFICSESYSYAQSQSIFICSHIHIHMLDHAPLHATHGRPLPAGKSYTLQKTINRHE